MMRRIVPVALVAACLVAVTHETSRADENFRWRVDSFDTLVNKAETVYFETEREALAHKQKYEKVRNLQTGGPAYTNWKITKERKPANRDADRAKDPKDGGKTGGDALARLREAKNAVGLALKAGKEELANKELLLREAIEDYKQAVADTYRRIKEFEKNLLKGTQEMQEQRSREINALVDRYNQQVNDFQAVMGPAVPLGYALLPRFQAPDSGPKNADKPPAAPVDADLQAQLQAKLIMGPPNLGWATISRTPPGFGVLYFDADDMGSVIGWLRDGGRVTGRWRATGSTTIEMEFPGVGVVRASLNGNQMNLEGCAKYPEPRVLKRGK